MGITVTLRTIIPGITRHLSVNFPEKTTLLNFSTESENDLLFYRNKEIIIFQNILVQKYIFW